VFLCALLAASVGAWCCAVVLVKKEAGSIENGSTHASIDLITKGYRDVIHPLALS
jgi:hypothetical protein